MPQRVSKRAVTHTESQGAGGSPGSKACVRMSAPCMRNGEGGEGGKEAGREMACPSPRHAFPWPPTPIVCPYHRDDAPSPLLLGILVTETQKRMWRRSQSRRMT